MNREEAAAVVEARHRIHVGVLEQVPPQRSDAGVGHYAGREDQPDATARTRQPQRALDEELIAVDVRSAVDHVHTRLADEVGQPPGVQLSVGADRGIAAVSAQHVPRRIADDGVEPCIREGIAALVEEDLRERQRPVKEAVPYRQLSRVVEQAVCHALRQRGATMQQEVAQISENGSGWRRVASQNHPAHQRFRTFVQRPSGECGA